MKATTWLAMPGEACSASPPKLVTTRSPGSSSSPSVWGMLTSRLNPVQHISRFRQMSVWKRWNSSSDLRTKKRNVSLCWRRSSVAPSSGARVGSGSYDIGVQRSLLQRDFGRLSGRPVQGRPSRGRPAGFETRRFETRRIFLFAEIRRGRNRCRRRVYACRFLEPLCIHMHLTCERESAFSVAQTFRDLRRRGEVWAVG